MPHVLDLVKLRGMILPRTAKVLDIALLERRLDWSRAVR